MSCLLYDTWPIPINKQIKLYFWAVFTSAPFLNAECQQDIHYLQKILIIIITYLFNTKRIDKITVFLWNMKSFFSFLLLWYLYTFAVCNASYMWFDVVFSFTVTHLVIIIIIYEYILQKEQKSATKQNISTSDAI